MMTVPTMRVAMMKEIQYLKEHSECKVLNVVFMGGEPFLNFYLIKETCEWIWREHGDLPIKFFARTNGTCLSEEMKTWLISNREKITIGLSLDGLPDVQDINRSGCSTRIPIDFFLKNWPNEIVKATVAPDSVHMLYSSFVYFYENKIPFSMMMAQGVDWSPDTLKELDNQLSLIVDYYIQNEELEIADFLFKKNFANDIQVITNCRRRMCGFDGERIAYAADGKDHPCFMLSELVLSRESGEYYNNLVRTTEYVEPDESCYNCPAQSFCSFCLGFNIKGGGNCNTRDKRICDVNYSLLRANCMLYIAKNKDKLLSGRLSKDEAKAFSFALNHINCYPN